MTKKPTYKDLEDRVKYLEAKVLEADQSSEISKGLKNISRLLQFAPYGVFLIDLSGKILYANENGAERLGKTSNEIVGTLLRDYFPPDIAESRRLRGIEAVKSGKPQHFEDQVRNRWYYSIIYPLKNSGGEEQFLAIYSTDVTEIKKADKALLHSQKMLTRTENIAHIGSWEWEIETDTVTWSEGLYRIFQLNPNEKPPTWAEHPKLYHPEDFEKLREAVENAVADGTPYTLELRALRKDGEIRNCLAHGYPEKNSAGQVVRLFGSLHDITERKQAEGLIRAQRDLAMKLNTLNNLDKSFEVCVDTALLVSGMDCGGIYLLDKISGGLDLVFQKGLPKQFVMSASHFEPDSANTELVMRRKPIYTEHQRLEIPIDDVKKGESLKAIAVIPIIHQNQVIGCLNVASHTNNEVPVFSRDALETIASQIGSAIIHLKTEEALRKSEVRFRELAELLPETLFETDLNGKLTFVNRGAFEKFGYTNQDFEEGLNAFEMVTAEDRKKAMENAGRILKGERIGLSEYRLVKKDGTTFPGILNSTPILLDGNPIGLRGLIMDITERKRAENQLEAVAREWRTTFDALSDAIWLLDNDFKIVRCNKATERILNKPIRDIVGKFCWQIVHGTDDVLPECPVFKMQKSFKRESLILQIGNQWFDIIVEPILNKKNQIDGAVHILRDITDRKQAQEALQENEQFLEKVFEAIRDGISVLDTDLNVIRTNQWMEQMYLHKMPLIGKKCFEAYQERSSPCPWCPTLKTIETGGVHSEIVPYPSAESPKGWIELSAFPLIHETGTVEGVIEYVKDISDHKRAEMALQESEERFRNVYSTAPLAFVIWDEETRVMDWNKKAEEVFGWSKDEIIGRNFFEFLIPENERPKVEDVVQNLVEGKLSNYSINDNLTKSGELITCEWSNSLLHDSAGNIIGAISLGLDITDRKRAEEALRQSEENYHQLFEAESDAVFLIDNETGNILQANRAACAMYGYSHEELLKMKNSDLSAEPEQTQKVMKETPPAVDQVITIPLRWHRKKDGKRFPVEITGRFFIQKGRPVHIAAIRDITERKYAEDDIRKSHQTLLTVLNEIDATIYVADMDTYEILFMNKHMINAFGADLTGRICYEVFRGETHPCGHCTNAQLLDADGKPTDVYIWETKNPITGKWYINYDRAIRWIDGRMVRLQIATDVSRLKELEQERIRTEEQLLQAQKMESVGRLAGGVAHDFNNMLGVILGHTELAMEQVDSRSPLYADLSEIKKATQRSADLTRQLLAFARRQTATPKVINLNDTVTGMLKMLRRLIGEDIDLAWIPGTALWAVRIDPAQVDQILANLCVNARDAINGVGNIIIETQNIHIDDAYCMTHPDCVPGDYVMLSVSDNGHGMDKETLKNLFEPFFTTKGVGEGTGLGLATIYGIVKQNEGLINVYSEPNQGATFKIYLPRTREAIKTKETKVSGEIARGTETVLLVEDEAAILNLGKAVLEKLGYTTLAARTPSEALDFCKKHPGRIQLLVTDVVMPEMNGKELKQKIETIKPGIKVLFMSGYPADIILRRGLLEKDINFLQKPFSVHSLSEKVREVLDQES